jgi:hypothetical protein
MPVETVPRTWTIASWLVPRVDAEAIGDGLADADVDAVALQSVTEDDVERVADRLGVRHAWELSFHPASRLIPGSGVGLAVLSRHSIDDSASVVTNNHSSTWSRHRRIAHFAVIRRSDHSGYTIGHAVGAPDPESMGVPPAPLVWFRPEQVGIDDTRAVDLPDGATVVETCTTTPLPGASELFVVTFEMPWVRGDYPVA